MKTNHVGKDYVMDVDNSWKKRSDPLLVLSIVFSSVSKKIFHPATSFETAFGQKCRTHFRK